MKNEIKKFEVGKTYWAGYYFPHEVLVIKERKGRKVTFDVVSERNIVDDKFNVIGCEAHVDEADVRKTVKVSEYWGEEMIDYKVPYTNNKRVTAFSVNEIVGGFEGLGAFQKQLLAEFKADQKERAIKEVEDISDEKLLKNISDEKWTISWFERQMKRDGITSIDDCYFDDRKKYAAVTARLEVYEKAFNDRVNAFINAMAAEMVDDGSNDDGEEENLTADYNFDVEEEDDELVDEAEVAVTAEEDNTTATEVQEVAKAAEELFAYGVQANRPVFGSVPSGYVKIDKYETEFKIRGVGYVFAVAYYEKPLEEKDIIGYDLVDIAAKRKAYEALHTPEAMAKAEEERKEHHKQLIKERIMRNCAAFEKGLREIDTKIAKLQDEMFSLSGTEETKKELDKLIVKRGKIATNYENEKAELASLEDEVDVTEYAVSPDAQEVAVQAEIDNAAREVQEEVSVTADLEKQLEKVLEDRDSRYAMIEDIRGDIKYVQALIIDCYKTIADYENETNDDLIDLDHNFKEIERLQAEAEKLQAEITNRKLNAAAVGMVDDGTNEEDAEEMTIDYNFDDEVDDDELIDAPIEYHIEFEIPAALELVPMTFEVERFGEDELTQKFMAVADTLIEEFAAQIKGIFAGLNQEIKFDAQLFNGEDTAEKEVALACLKANVIENLKWIDELGLRGWENGFVYEPVAKKAAENAQTYIKIAYARIADAENEMWNVALEIEEKATADPAVEEVPVVDEDAEIKKLEKELAELDALIKTLKAQSAAKSDLIAKKCQSVIDWAYSELDKAADKYDKDFIKIKLDDGKIIKLYKDVDGRDEYKLANENERWEYLIIERMWDFETKSDFIRIQRHTREIVRYSNVKNFKAAVREFAEAINRGDTEFTFPADDANNTANA